MFHVLDQFVILEVLPEGGCWRTLSALRKYWGRGHITDRAGGRGGGNTGEEMGEDRNTTDVPAVREWNPKPHHGRYQ